MTNAHGKGFEAPRTKMPALADALDIAQINTPTQSAELQWWAPGWFIKRDLSTGKTQFVKE